MVALQNQLHMGILFQLLFADHVPCLHFYQIPNGCLYESFSSRLFYDHLSFDTSFVFSHILHSILLPMEILVLQTDCSNYSFS